MEGTIANELYSEILNNSTSTNNPLHDTSVLDDDNDDLWYEDGSSFDGAVKSSVKESDIDREWSRRHDQFHTIGYRDGLIAGKEASAQEGFNIGFKESVFVGRNFGFVRGVTSALASLPDGLRERLVEVEEKRIKFRDLNKSVNSVSTTDALKLFNDGLTNKLVKSGNSLEYYHNELQSLILESPAIKQTNLDKE